MQRLELAVFCLQIASSLILISSIWYLSYALIRYAKTEIKFRKAIKERRVFFKWEDEK